MLWKSVKTNAFPGVRKGVRNECFLELTTLLSAVVLEATTATATSHVRKWIHVISII